MSFFKDKSRIFKYVKNIDRSTKIGVADDFPKEIEKIRKTLFLVLKDTKKKNDKAELNVDKLIIIYGRIYRGPETANLPFYARILSA